jgi:ABC-type multidrug transport system ATPase subunit
MTVALPQDESSLDRLPAMAVRLERVSRLYGSFVALREVSLTLPAGASVVLLGENGAGKSTLLKVIAGLTTPSYGTVQVFGEAPQQQRGRISVMSHATMLYDELTGMENLAYFAGLNGLGESAAQEHMASEALRAVGLDAANPRRVGEYSQGMRQRASLARALLAQPELLLLDEPFSNLDVESVHRMIDRLLAYVAESAANTLLLTTHQAALAEPLARTKITMQAGSVASVVEKAGAR